MLIKKLMMGLNKILIEGLKFKKGKFSTVRKNFS